MTIDVILLVPKVPRRSVDKIGLPAGYVTVEPAPPASQTTEPPNVSFRKLGVPYVGVLTIRILITI